MDFFVTGWQEFCWFWGSGAGIRFATAPERLEMIPRAPPDCSRHSAAATAPPSPAGSSISLRIRPILLDLVPQPLCKLQWGSGEIFEKIEISKPYSSELIGSPRDLSSAIVSTHRVLKGLGATFLIFLWFSRKVVEKWEKTQNPLKLIQNWSKTWILRFF